MEEEIASKIVTPPEANKSPIKPSSKLFSKIFSVLRKKWWLLLIVLIILGGGIFALGKIWKSPEKIIGQMFKNMSEVKSFAYEVDGSFEENIPSLGLPQEGEKILEALPGLSKLENVKINIKAQGKIDVHDINNPQMAGSYEVKSSSDGLEISFAGESIIKDKRYYFKVTELPALPVLGLDLSQLKDQWYGLGEEEIKKLEEARKEAEKELEKKEPEELAQLEKEMEEIGQLIVEIKPWGVKKLKDEEIQNERCYHFQVFLKKEETLKLIDELTRKYNKELSSEDKEKLGEVLAKIENYPLEIWITKKNYYLKRILFSGTFEIPADKETSQIKANIDMICSQFNQTFTIEAPKDYKSPKELVEQILGGLTPTGLPGAGKDSDLDGMPDEWEIKYKLDSNNPLDSSEDKDQDGLTNLEEYKYDTDPTDPDTDGDGFKDGDEVKKGYHPKGYGRLTKEEKKELDSDRDGMPDEWEIKYGLNPKDLQDGYEDGDKDELSNLLEYKYATDPTNPDTDGDGYKDGEEIRKGFNPYGPGKLKFKAL